MPRIVRETLISVRDLVLTWGPFLLVGLGLLVAAYLLLDPAPPRRVVLATGPEQSAYAAFGKRSEEHTSELQSRVDLVCRLLLEKKKKKRTHRSCNTCLE